KWTVPQRFFLHFYWFGVAWTSFLLVITWNYASKTAPLHRYKVWVSVFLLLLMETHVLRRLYETIYVLNYSPSARMHILGYLTGLFFYAAAPLSLCHFCAFKALNFAVDEGSLRRRDREQREEYAIPRGDWFELVSSPHYTAEMLIYAGLLIASGATDYIMWLLLLFVVSWASPWKLVWF
ncbi:unnamed protein product, partial [Linum tenue]